MKKVHVSLFFTLIGLCTNLFAQKTCTSNPTTISSNINFGSITWTASGGATVAECNNMADGLITFTGNVIVDVANNTTITISNNVNITGNFPITGGPGSVLSVTGNKTLNVTGNLGNNNNNGVTYNVQAAGDAIIVGGTLFGKNNTAFSGSGSISGGTLDVKNGSTCGSPCPVTGGFSNCISSNAFCTSFNVPIDLLFFKASRGLNNVFLSWATTSELNFDYFDIEKSTDGANFISIAVVKGNGTTTDRHDYSFNDEKPLIGKNYYRLKSVDFDGYSEYFDIAMVEFDSKKGFIVYPNPVQSGNEIKIELNFVPQYPVEVALYDLSGRQILRRMLIGSSANLPVQLTSGMYMVRFNSPEYKSVSKFLVHD